MGPRIVHLGLGPLGVLVVAELVRRPVGRLVAVVDPAHAGRRLSDLVPGAPDLRVAADLGGCDADAAVVTTVSRFAQILPTLRELSARGLRVVSTCEQLAWPVGHPGAAELDAACKRHNAAIVGTGVNPGFLMDALPVALTSLCRQVRAVRVERIQDATPRRVPFQAKIGVGMTEQALLQGIRRGTAGHAGLPESIRFLAACLGFELDRVEQSAAAVPADIPLETPLGTVPAGAPRGVEQIGRGWVGDRPVIELLFRAALGEPEPRDRIVIDGDPGLDVRLEGGVHGDTATVAITVNALRVILAAPPGLHTMASLPMPGCWAPPGAC